jgi:hypothetical protein
MLKGVSASVCQTTIVPSMDPEANNWLESFTRHCTDSLWYASSCRKENVSILYTRSKLELEAVTTVLSDIHMRQ